MTQPRVFSLSTPCSRDNKPTPETRLLHFGHMSLASLTIPANEESIIEEIRNGSMGIDTALEPIVEREIGLLMFYSHIKCESPKPQMT